MSDDKNRSIAERIVRRWSDLLVREGVLHGELAYSDELVDIIEDELKA